MKKFTFFLSVLFLIVESKAAIGTLPKTVSVTEAESILLFRYVGGVVPLTENATHQFLHVDVMMCSVLFNMGSKKIARCLLPTEQVRIEQENGVEITTILQNHNMPINFQFGYETRQAGLDCTKALNGNEAPVCTLTEK